MAIDLLIPRREIIIPKPKSYIKLDMAFGVGAGTKLMDKSRYRSHGTISGADWADGAHGRCLDFNPATPSYVEIPAAYTQLDFTSEKFSIIARIYIDNLTSNRQIWSRGLHGSDGYFFAVLNTGQLIADTSQLVYQFTRSESSVITTGTWWTVGCSRVGATIKLYRNGVEPTYSVVGVHIDPLTSARTAKIGIYNNLTSNPFDGKIEFLRIFGGIALSAKAHLAWHNALA